MRFQIDIHNKREKSNLSKIAKQAKRAYHRWIRHCPIKDDDVGGHFIKKYPDGWMN